MQNKFFSAFLFTLVLSVSTIAAESLTELTDRAVSANANESKTAIENLRKMGQTGLDALFVKYEKEIETYKTNGKPAAGWEKITAALDAVAMQKDAYAARLYWHTDFEAAKAEAQKENKPILSLRLLGNLNEEYSCANSRFFRSILYSHAGISDFLRNNYVLYWKSVRPAPKVTVDFGDGRKIVKTLTGNSIHYALDKNGRFKQPPRVCRFLIGS